MDDQARCPACRAVSDWQEFDCLGADEDRGWCPACHREVEPVDLWGELSDRIKQAQGQMPLFGEVPDGS